MNLYYISFATWTEFLGATVVEGVNEKQAYEIACNNDLVPYNNHAQAAIIKIPEVMYEHPEVVPFKYKLLTKKDIEALGLVYVRNADLNEEMRHVMEINSVVI